MKFDGLGRMKINPDMHRSCSECDFVDASLKRRPDEDYCRLAESYQPRKVCGVPINCANFKENSQIGRQWDL